MNENWFIFVRGMGMTVFAMSFAYLLTDSRFSKKYTRKTVILSTVLLIAVNTLLFAVMGRSQYGRCLPLVLHLPSFLPYLWISRHRDFRLVFTLFTNTMVNFAIAVAGIVCSMPFEGSVLADTIGRVLFGCLFILLFWHVRALYFFMQETLKRGWLIFCLIPLAYYTAVYFLALRFPREQWVERLPFYLSLTAIVILAYVVIFFFFWQFEKHAEKEHEHKLLRVQLAAYHQQSEVLLEGERRLTTLRHDMRHYIHTLTTLLQEGDMEHALQVTKEYDKLLLSSQTRRWCDNKAVNAILSYYLDQAEQNDIQVESVLDLPDMQGSIELSIVLANMVENALHACCRQPLGVERRIALHAVSTPQLVIEVKNTFGGEVHWGPDGLPLPAEKGHGIGTKSIRDFARRHNASFTFQVKDGMFQVRLLILPQGTDASRGLKE